MWISFEYRTMTGHPCRHSFYCLGPFHLKEILDRYNINFDDMEHIGIERGRTISRKELRELFKSRRRAHASTPQ